VMVVDRHPDRLRLAESIGAIPIDDSKVDPVEAVLEETMGLGADNGCECVGYQAHDPEGNEHPNDTLNKLVKSVRFTGRIGSVGVFVPQGPGGSDELAKNGQVAFDYGMYLVQGPAHRQRPGAGQKVQPAVARPDRRRQGRAVIHRQPRAAAEPGTGGLLPLRRPGRRLDQGRAQVGAGQRLTGQGDVALLVRVQPVDLPATTLPGSACSFRPRSAAAVPTTTTERDHGR
jgi:hypothetical protein